MFESALESIEQSFKKEWVVVILYDSFESLKKIGISNFVLCRGCRSCILVYATGIFLICLLV